MTVPKTPAGIRARIKSYERKLRAEKRKFGGYDDSSGKRYMIGPLYMVLGNQAGALKAFQWFKRSFPDDIGEPGLLLCWTLALHRAEREGEAVRMLAATMLRNRHILLRLLEEQRLGLEIKPQSDEWDQLGAEQVPAAYLDLWTTDERDWARSHYHGKQLSDVRERHIGLLRALEVEPLGPKRNLLVKGLSALERF